MMAGIPGVKRNGNAIAAAGVRVKTTGLLGAEAGVCVLVKEKVQTKQSNNK